MRAIAPAPFDTDRYWLAWLGRRILDARAIPRALGTESPLDAGHPWIPHEWLYALAAAFFRDHHAFWIFALLNALCVAALVWTSAWLCERYEIDERLAIPVVCVAAFVLTARFSLRAENVSDAALALLLPLAVSRRKWFLPLAFVVWANMHAGFAFGLALLAVWWIFDRQRWRENALLFTACAAATLVTPFGLALWAYVWWVPHSWIPSVVQEWQPAWRIGPGFVALLAGPLLFLVRGVRMDRRKELCVYLLTFAFALAAMRNVPVACALGLPCGLAASRAASPSRSSRFALAFGAAIAVALFVTNVPRAQVTRDAAFGLLLPRDNPITRMSATNFNGSLVACEQPFLCNVVLLQGGRTMYDGRTDPFPERRAHLQGATHDAQLLLALRDLGPVSGFTAQRWPTDPALYVYAKI